MAAASRGSTVHVPNFPCSLIKFTAEMELHVAAVTSCREEGPSKDLDSFPITGLMQRGL
jgi:hypothetical protein